MSAPRLCGVCGADLDALRRRKDARYCGAAHRTGHLDDPRVRTTPSRGSGFRATSTSSLWRYNQRRSMDGRATFGSAPLRAVDSALPWNYSLEQEI
jgi:hypothetical protein